MSFTWSLPSDEYNHNGNAIMPVLIPREATNRDLGDASRRQALPGPQPHPYHHHPHYQPPPPIIKKEVKPRGRIPAYAYFVQTCREEYRKKYPNENIVFTEFSKECAQRWKNMSETERKCFHDMAERDKQRYEAEMANYKPAKGERGRKRKRVKDPNAPKRALSAFFWFCQDERSKIKQANPELSIGEIAKRLGKRWNEAGEEVRSKYEALSTKDKARYEIEVLAYKGKKARGGMPMGDNPSTTAKKDSSDQDEDDDDEGNEYYEGEENV